jgi:hypothetical protein
MTSKKWISLHSMIGSKLHPRRYQGRFNKIQGICTFESKMDLNRFERGNEAFWRRNNTS